MFVNIYRYLKCAYRLITYYSWCLKHKFLRYIFVLNFYVKIFHVSSSTGVGKSKRNDFYVLQKTYFKTSFFGQKKFRR